MGLQLLQAGQKGVMVRRIEPTLPGAQQLRKGDILLSFEGTQIGNDGTVAFRSGERINFSYLISEKQNNEDVRLAVHPTPLSASAWLSCCYNPEACCSSGIASNAAAAQPLALL